MSPTELAQRVFAPLNRARSNAGACVYYAVGNAAAPRWLIPAGHPEIDAMLAGWSPYLLSSRLRWLAFRAANRCGRIANLPGIATLEIAGVGDIDWQRLGWPADSLPVPLVYLGTPGPGRKAVIHLVDRSSGLCTAIVKVPLAPAARLAILHEAAILSRLEAEAYSHAPRVLCVDHELAITTQTAIPGKPGLRKFGAAYAQILMSLLLRDEHATLADYSETLNSEFLESHATDTATLQAAVIAMQDTTQLPACWVHGDFAPWNTKHAPDGTIGLVDWEHARRACLPLQDAFHFFHMQDYLFAKRSKIHSGHIAAFATQIGLTLALCQRLEIAYLLRSYLENQRRGNAELSTFSLATLKLLLKQCPTSSLQIAGSQPTDASVSLRKELFTAFVREFDASSIPYCLLSGYIVEATRESSDVDFMVRKSDAKLVPALLARVANFAGGQLVQAIQHETTANYFVLAKQEGPRIVYLQPDLTTDYRRRRRLWLRANRIFLQVRRQHDFFAASPSDEFIYYLVKKICKDAMSSSQLERIGVLFRASPHTCHQELLKFWPVDSVQRMEAALSTLDLDWFRSTLKTLRAELEASSPTEPLLQRWMNECRNLKRLMHRLIHPTGMFLRLSGTDESKFHMLAAALRANLAPAFRRSWIIQQELCPSNVEASSWIRRVPPILRRLRLRLRIQLAKVRSTLIIELAPRTNRDELAKSRSRWTRSLEIVANALVGPDIQIELVVSTSGQDCDQSAKFATSRCDTFFEALLADASRIALQWLANRMSRRLQLDTVTAPIPATSSTKIDPGAAGAVHAGRAT